MPSKLLKEIAAYCWSNNFLDVFRNFFTEHASVFEGAPTISGGEHNMEYFALFQIYLKLYEATLETYLKEINVSISEFYQEVRDAQNETHDPYLLTFIDCLLASADYESFYKVMTREGAKSLAKKAHDKRSKTNPAVDIKADSKTSSSSSTTDSPAGSKNAATYDSDHKGSSLSPSLATDDKYSHK